MNDPNRLSPAFILGAWFAVLACAVIASLFLGNLIINPFDVFNGQTGEATRLAKLVIIELRLPRAILAILVGASLGVSGAALQGLLRNPLAEPGLLGVSSGASLGAVIAIYFGLAHAFPLATPLLGLIGALGAGALTFALGRKGTLTLILAGAAITGLMGTLVNIALNLAPSPYAAYEMNNWLLGSISEKSWADIALSAPFMAAGLALLAFTGRAVDSLSLGELQAKSLGIDLDRTRILILLGVGLSVGAATSVTGAIGFVGLVAPHLVRPFVGHQPSRLLLPSALVGASLLLAADLVIRLIPTATELKLGVITSLVGAPFFFWLVLRLQRTAP